MRENDTVFRDMVSRICEMGISAQTVSKACKVSLDVAKTLLDDGVISIYPFHSFILPFISPYNKKKMKDVRRIEAFCSFMSETFDENKDYRIAESVKLLCNDYDLTMDSISKYAKVTEKVLKSYCKDPISVSEDERFNIAYTVLLLRITLCKVGEFDGNLV